MEKQQEAGQSGRAADYERAVSASEAVAVFDADRVPVTRRLQQFLNEYPTAVPFAVLLLGIIVFSALAGGKFISPYNLSLILQQVTIIGVVGIAQTIIILTAGIDLSVGVIMVLSSIVAGRVAVSYGLPVEVAFAAGALTGIACGAINGALVSYLKLPPFIVTLGTLSIFGSLNIWYSESRTIRQQDIETVAPALQWTGTAFNIGGAQITVGTLLLVLLACVVWYVLNRTPFGRHVYAVGDDANASRLAGIDVRKTTLTVYVIAGAICAFAAWLLIGRIGAVTPNAGGTANLDSITAVVIGGTSLFGGRGSVVGTLVGALIVGVFRNGLALSGVDVLWQEFAVGILVIIAVILDQWIRKVGS